MATHGSNFSEQPGQYPTTAWDLMGLPNQNFGSGAAGTTPQDSTLDAGGSNQPAQYPGRETFTGMALDGSGAPGTQGVAMSPVTGPGGPDTVTFDEPTFFKGEFDQGPNGVYDDDGKGLGKGYKQNTTQATVSGRGDWTQANLQGYQADPQYQMPGVAGNTPAPGDGRYNTDGQIASGHVMWGGWRRGQRPATPNHPGYSGPGT